MGTDMDTGWHHRKRSRYETETNSSVGIPLPEVTWLSDLLPAIDSKRQKGYNDEDLPPQFTGEKSFVRLPHCLLASDGYPRSDQWDHSSCQPYVKKQKVSNPRPSSNMHSDLPFSSLESIKDHKTVPDTTSSISPLAGHPTELDGRSQIAPEHSKQVPSTLPSLFDLENGRESIVVPVPGKVQRGRVTRHPIKARMSTEARRLDVSSTCASKKKGNPFNKELRRTNDPILPVHDYERTMEIVSKLYFVVTHGHGQFVDQQTKKLICTFSYENFEMMDDATRKVHQSDVDTVMMATKLFNRMPIEPNLDLANSPQEMKNSEMVVTKSESTSTASTLQHSESKQPTKSMYPVEITSRLELDDNANQLLDSSPLTSLETSAIDENESHPNNYTNRLCHDIGPLLEEVQIQLDHFMNGTISIKPRESSPLTPLASSDESDHEEPKALYTHVKASTITAKKAKKTTNGALVHGKMFCFGGRAGYKKDILFSPYLPRIGVSLSLYKLFLSELPNFGANFGSRFQTFADEAFLTARTQLNILGVPSLASVDKNAPRGPLDYAGNFAFTFHNFWNKPHTDNDKGKVYCVWYPMDSCSGRIVTSSEGFILEGGFFLFPEYRLAFNFGSRYVVQISWSGKTTFHQTIQSKETKQLAADGSKIHYTRLGCSSQITSSMARAAVKLGTNEQFNFTSNCEREALDCQDILKLKGREWKE
ncbi:hypothetical protein DFH28DRAFT_227627 [Melampsora americana]|nr:hypothetical protein DFH28DRAFT_227627 [Melampsora americana]